MSVGTGRIRVRVRVRVKTDERDRVRNKASQGVQDEKLTLMSFRVVIRTSEIPY